MKMIFLYASIIIASGLLITNICTSIIDAKIWGSNIPDSIITAREYFKTINLGNFFRVFSPSNQVLALLALVLFWKSNPGARWYLGVALVCYVFTDVITFAYFYPRNDILFKTTPLPDTATLQKAWSQWNSMNWVRSLIGLIGIVFSFISLHKIYTIK